MTQRFAAALGVLTFICASAARAELTLVPGTPVTENGVTRVDVVVLNESTSAQLFTASEKLQCRTASGPALLSLMNPVPARQVLPGQFVRVSYVVDRSIPALTNLEIVPVVPAPIPATSANTPQPAAQTPFKTVSSSLTDENYHQEFGGLVEFLSYRLRPYEPVYFLVGTDRPNAKFQLSLKYQLFGKDGTNDPRGVFSPLSGLFLAYSQTSFWDLEGDSKPFFDNSYRPEVFFAFDRLDEKLTNSAGDRILPENMKFAIQTGLKHESNGKDGLDSRSLNIVYVRPIFTFTLPDDNFITIAPSAHAYVFGKDENNDDIEDYRGYGDLKLVFGKHGGVQLAAIGRIGDDWEHGSLQLDLSFPIRKLTGDNFDIYFHTQYFTGYGESLLGYNEEDTSWRVGISMVR